MHLGCDNNNFEQLSSRRFLSRPVIVIKAPQDRNASAIAYPIPLVPPVMSAFLPFNKSFGASLIILAVTCCSGKPVNK